jgi:CheY-like chemotaxis protein
MESGAPPPANSGFIGPPDHRTSVLLVDDDRDFREAAELVLQQDGYEVTVASNGGEALERLAALADAHLPFPDVLVLDFVMPKLSGLGLVRAMKRFKHAPPTILVTGFVDPSVRRFAATLGTFRVLRKPFDGEELCATVEEAALYAAKARDVSRRA